MTRTNELLWNQAIDDENYNLATQLAQEINPEGSQAQTNLTLGYHYPEATDAYLSGLERVDSHKGPGDIAKAKPEVFRQYILDRIVESTRRVEEARRALGYYASVCERLHDELPEFFDRLPADDQHVVNDMARRIAAE